VLCEEREDRGRSSPTEVIHANGIIAVVTYYRNGGGKSTSGEEALSRSNDRSLKHVLHDVTCSPWRVETRWTMVAAHRRRGLPSCWPLLLGADAWRTPARGGGAA
jgi:hypothetical protein